jgi:hypothetical protein
MTAIDRRTFLGGAVLGTAILGSGKGSLATIRSATKRVVLVAFAGGVRARETLGTPANVPNLMRIAEQGVLYTRARHESGPFRGDSLDLHRDLRGSRNS